MSSEDIKHNGYTIPNGDIKVDIKVDPSSSTDIPRRHVTNKANSEGKRLASERESIIKGLMADMINPLCKALSEAKEGSAAKDLYLLIEEGYESTTGKKDGWQVFTEEWAQHAIAKGEGWGNPEEQLQAINGSNGLKTEPSPGFLSGIPVLGKTQAAIKTAGLHLRKLLSAGIKESTKHAQIYEILFAMQNVFMAIKYNYKLLTLGQLLAAAYYFTEQTTISAIINYNGVDPEEVYETIRPILKIGNTILDGLEQRPYHKGNESRKADIFHIDLSVDPEFMPGTAKYNEQKVAFTTRALRYWLEQQRDFREYTITNYLFNSSFLNTLSYEWSNTMGANFNWLAVPAVLVLLASGRWLTLSLIALPDIVRAGRAYYEAFTWKGVLQARKTIATNESLLALTWRNSYVQGAEATLLQWLPNGLSRGFSFTLTTREVFIFYLAIALSWGFTIPGGIDMFMAYVTGVLGLHNTLQSRMKGAKKYLKPNTVSWFLGDGNFQPMIIVNPEFLGELESIDCKEYASSTLKGFVSGLLTAFAPIFIILSYFNGWGTPEAAGLAASIALLPAAISFTAEKRDAQKTRARKKIEGTQDDDAKSTPTPSLIPPTLQGLTVGAAVGTPIYYLGEGLGAPDFIYLAVVMGLMLGLHRFAAKYDKMQYELKPLRDPADIKASEKDVNGNLKLTKADTETANLVFNFVDQASRAFGTAGSTAAFMLNAGVSDIGFWPQTILWNAIFFKPRFNEFFTYVMSTHGYLTNGFNDIRERAGTPIDKIVDGYKLVEVDVMPDETKFSTMTLDKATLYYLRGKVNPLTYYCQDRNGKNVIGVIEKGELPISTEGPATLKRIKDYLPRILEITFRRGHTLGVGKFKHWRARQMLYWYPELFGRIDGISDQPVTAWIGCTSRNQHRLVGGTGSMSRSTSMQTVPTGYQSLNS